MRMANRTGRQEANGRGSVGLPTASARPMTREEVLRDAVPEMTRRIIEIAHPLRVILFGSAARGDMGPDSDLDVLVVVPNGVSCRRTCQDIYMGLRGLGVSKDVLVVTERQLTENGDKPWWVYNSALTEGRELYHAQA